MINLLPPKEKIEFLQEETKKLTILIGIVIVVSLICLSLILFAIQTYIWGQAESQKITLKEAQKEFASSELQELQEKIQTTNLSFAQLNSFYQQKPYLTELLEDIFSILPKGMYLINLFLNPTEEKTQISLSGFSPSREILLKFNESLEADPDFKEIYFPRDSWIKIKDIDFFVSFSL